MTPLLIITIWVLSVSIRSQCKRTTLKNGWRLLVKPKPHSWRYIVEPASLLAIWLMLAAAAPTKLALFASCMCIAIFSFGLAWTLYTLWSLRNGTAREVRTPWGRPRIEWISKP